MGDAPRRDWLLGHDLLATAARLACRRCLACTPPCSAGTVERCKSAGLEPRLARQRLDSRQKGGEGTGPNPLGRGKPGTKRHVVVDAEGTPLGITLSSSNRHDSMMLAAKLDAIPSVRHGRGRPRRRPCRLYNDKAYNRKECRQRAIEPRIAQRGVDTSDRLGRHRWVVERTFAWLNRFRRLSIRYERRLDIHMAFTVLGCALVCLNQISRFC